MLTEETRKILKSSGYDSHIKKINCVIHSFYNVTKDIQGNHYLLSLVLSDFKKRAKDNNRNPERVKNILGDALQKAYISRLHMKPYNPLKNI